VKINEELMEIWPNEVCNSPITCAGQERAKVEIGKGAKRGI